MIRSAFAIALSLTLAACDRSAPPANHQDNAAGPSNGVAKVAPVPAPPPIVVAEDKDWPPAPGTPGGLPDDRRPVAEMNRDMNGPQGASSALEIYVVNVEAKHWTRAHKQWGDDKSAIAFEQRWRDASDVHGLIGTPGDAEGGCGSIYSEVPVQFYGTRLNGTRFNSIGKAVMRRVNGVDGATPGQLSWHVDSITLKDTH